MRREHNPVLFITGDDDYDHDLATLRHASPSVTQNVVCVIAGSSDASIRLREACALSSLWSSVRLLQLYVEDPDDHLDLTAAAANPNQGPQPSPFEYLQALCLYEELPTRLISSILAHCTPLLRDLEVVPVASAALEEPSPAQCSPSSSPYPQYSFQLRRLSYFGDDYTFFCHLFAQSRRTLTWLALMLLGDLSDDLLGCIAEGNRVQKFIYFPAEDFRTSKEPETGYRLLAAFPRLRVLMMDHNQLAASPELLVHCAVSLRRLIIILEEGNAEMVEASMAVLVSALLRQVHSFRQLQEITLVHDPDYPHSGGSQIFADLRALCTPGRIRLTEQTFEVHTRAESPGSMIGRLVA